MGNVTGDILKEKKLTNGNQSMAKANRDNCKGGGPQEKQGCVKVDSKHNLPGN